MTVTVLQPHEPPPPSSSLDGAPWEAGRAGAPLGGPGGVGYPPAIDNAEADIAALHRRARASINARRLRGGLSLRVRLLRPTAVGGRELMGAAQGTHVLLAPHDPSVATVLYLRPGATVVEVAPFAYYGGGVAALAGALGLTYRRVVAQPDGTTFRACVAAVKGDGWGGAVPSAAADAAAAALLAAWDAAADAHAAYGKVDGLRLDLGVGEDRGPGGGDAGARRRLPRERERARSQRLAPDPAAVAATVVAAAVEVCNPLPRRG